MTISVIATQVESLGQSPAKANAIAATLELTQAAPDRRVDVHAAELEYTFVQPDKAIKTHGTQFESLQVERPGPVRVADVQIEVLVPLPESQTAVVVDGAFIDVLRGIPSKKRRPPTNVVAN